MDLKYVESLKTNERISILSQTLSGGTSRFMGYETALPNRIPSGSRLETTP
jgi:hypothetical protein